MPSLVVDCQINPLYNRVDYNRIEAECYLQKAMTAARNAGGEYRGLLSAVLLVLHPEQPPLTLRVDIRETDPLYALRHLYEKATTVEYAQRVRQVPVSTD